MLSLTLRSGRDGRFLARVVDQGGRPFVLDYGDPRIIEDLVQRITRGFTVIRQGRLLHVHPGDDDLLIQLACFYADEGALVFFEEPGWSGRRGVSVPRVVHGLGSEDRTLDTQDLPEEDDPTESVELSDLPSVDEALTTLLPPEDLGESGGSMGRLHGDSHAVPAEDPREPDDDLDLGMLPGAPVLDER